MNNTQEQHAGPNGSGAIGDVIAAHVLGQNANIELKGGLHAELSEIKVSVEAGDILKRVHGVVNMDRSPISEAFKMLRAQVLQKMRAGGWNSLAVTSARYDEGKTLTALNLALCIAAEIGKTALLIDADFVQARLQHLFGLDQASGLSDYLVDGRPLPELFVNPGINRLVVLPAGREVSNSSELLGTEAMGRLLRELKQRYTDLYVIIDLPPMLSTADALSFLPHVDATLLVAEEGRTTQEDLQRVAQLLAPFNLIGSVLNKSSNDFVEERRDARARGRAAA